jgi:peptidylprolyl isomerase
MANTKTKTADASHPAVKKGDKVKVHYTGKLDDGTVFDSSEGRNPLSFTIGNNEVIPGFENGIEGMKVKDKKTIKINSDDAYGPVIKELVLEVPRSKLPPQPEPQVGMQLVMRDPSGRQIPARIVKVEKDKVTLDLNHPLAGKNLNFDLEIVGINEPDDEEEECGCGSCHDDCSGCGGGCGGH